MPKVQFLVTAEYTLRDPNQTAVEVETSLRDALTEGLQDYRPPSSSPVEFILDQYTVEPVVSTANVSNPPS